MHPYLPQPSLLHFCKRHSIIVTAYSPLGSPGRDTKPLGEPSLIQEEAVLTAASAAVSLPSLATPSFASAAGASEGTQGVTAGQALLLWSWHRAVAAIPKSVTPSRIRQNYW